jgi:hypothetical protein
MPKMMTQVPGMPLGGEGGGEGDGGGGAWRRPAGTAAHARSVQCHQGTRRVTDDTRFAGGSLVQAQRRELLAWLAEYGITGLVC